MEVFKIIRFGLESTVLSMDCKNKLIRESSLGDMALFKIFNDVMSRRVGIVPLLKEREKFESPFIRALLELYNYRFVGKKISDPDFYLTCELMEERKKLIPVFLTALIPVLRNIDQIRFLIESNLVRSYRHKFSILRAALELGEFEYFDSVIALTELNDSSREKLHILYCYYSRSINHIELESLFGNNKYFQDYFSYVNRFWCNLALERDFIDLRSSKLLQERLESLICSHLRNGEGFSFMRLSDGEAYGFSTDKALSTRQENHWWGCTLPEELRDTIKKDFLNKVINSKVNFLGLPTTHKFAHYIGFNDRGFDCISDLDKKVINRLGYIVNSVSDLVLNGCFSHANICEDQVNNAIFDLNYFERISIHCKRLIIISGFNCKTVESVFERVEVPKVVIEIPTHNSFKSRNDIVDAELPLPFVYQSILDEISSTVNPGDLCLVSGGFIGKMFVAECQKKGAVSIDIGQVLGREIENAE